MHTLTWLAEDDYGFPDPTLALNDPNGLLAIGGDLVPERLLHAYQAGIFPWFENGQAPLWWSPDPRMVLFPEEIHCSRSLKKLLRKNPFSFTTDTAFEQVIIACAGSRLHSSGTWITAEMHEAYCQLHALGFAHSIEVWQQGELAGGLYGIAMGKVFFGESMFSHRNNASKLALVLMARSLSQQGFKLIDCQVSSAHLASLGAREISRASFQRYLPDSIIKTDWQIDLHKSMTGNKL